MKLSLVVMLFLSVSSAFGQDKLRVSGFKGLDTRTSDLTVTPEYLRDCNNCDISRFGIGTIGSRRGTDSVSTKTGADSVLSVASYLLRDGRKFLTFVADSSNVGYGSIYLGAQGSHNINSFTRLWQYWNVMEPTGQLTYNDWQFFYNGTMRAILYDGARAQPYPSPASGEPFICPIIDSSNSYHLDAGEYRYVLTGRRLSSAPTTTDEILYNGIVSQPVRLTRAGRVLLTWFSRCSADSVQAKPDTMIVRIWRTRVNPGTIDNADSIWVVGLTPASTYQVITTATTSFTYIDSIPDGSRHTGAISGDLTSPRLAIDRTYRGVDSNGNRSYYVGSCGVLSRTSVAETDSLLSKIYGGINGVQNKKGVGYWAAPLDTVTGIIGDTCRGTFVFDPTGTTQLSKVTITVPRVPLESQGLIWNIYRAHLVRLVDSLGYRYVDSSRTIGFHITRTNELGTTRQQRFPSKWKYEYTHDTLVVGPLFLVAQVKGNDTSFVDSTRWDNLVYKERFRGSQPPFIEHMIEDNGTLLASSGSRVYTSNFDSVNRWGVFDFSSFGENDGDVITGLWSTQFGTRVMKNQSTWLLPLDYSRPIQIGGYGCTGGRTIASGESGHMYLAQDNVYLEIEGKNLEQTFESGNLSERLSNFRDLPIASKQSAFGIYLPKFRQYLLSVNYPSTSTDTTFIWDAAAGGWTTMTGVVAATGCLYDTGTTVTFKPPETLYFVKPGSSVLYRYGKSTTSVSDIVTITTAPMFLNPPTKTQIVQLAVWGNGTSSLGFQANFLDETGTGVSNVKPWNSMTNRYNLFDIVSKPVLYNKLRITGDFSGGTSYFDGFEFVAGQTEEEGAQ